MTNLNNLQNFRKYKMLLRLFIPNYYVDHFYGGFMHH